jgi:predicted  nucleic acid-binding Zn-ribbon protein
MAEVEFAGVKFKGGKMVAVFLALSTLVGGLYGAFEVYKDYMDMKKKILSYSAPDLSGFDKKLAVMNKEMKVVVKEMGSVRTRVLEVQDIVRDTRQDTRSDAASLEAAISSVDKRSRTLDSETRAALRQGEKTIRSIVSSANERFDSKINGVSTSSSQSVKNMRDIIESAATRFDAKINGIDSKLDAFEKRQDKKLQRALDNPLLRK